MSSAVRSAALSFLAAAAGCASQSASGVPIVHPERLHVAQFVDLTPRQITLEVLDERSPTPEGSKEMVTEVRRAVSASLNRAGFKPASQSAHVLQIRVAYKDKPLPSYDREDCIWFRGKLSTLNGSSVQAEAGACFEWRNIYGMDLGGDASTAFETGLSGMLEQLDRGWATLPKP